MAQKIPKHVRLILSETRTIFLLEYSSYTALSGTEEGDACEESNKLYEYLTSDKGRNRKVSTVGVQTLPSLRKTRSTEPQLYKYQESSTFASNWEMFDTYKAQKKTVEYCYEIKFDEETDEMNAEVSLGHPLIDPKKKVIPKTTTDLLNLEENNGFFDAALVIERLLANNTYNIQQKRFKGLSDPDTFRDNIEFKYRLNFLWTFANQDTRSRAVTGISFNPLSEDIIAVSYGKYYYNDRKKTGIIMIWNVKNPKQPEREYYFCNPVTCLEFSQSNPNVLAVGFYNGDVKILDVSNRDLSVLREDSSVSYEPVNMLVWFRQSKKEHLLACFGDGRVCKFEMIYALQLTPSEIMRTLRVDGKVKGWEDSRMFQGSDSDAYRYASATSLCLHSVDPYAYFVSSGEGVIHRCSLNSRQHLEMAKAHNGRIHQIKFSPFMTKLYATCGDDFQACIWAEGIEEPLIVSRFTLEPVLDVDWSPAHSTVMVSLRGDDICIWDLQRKVYQPQSQTKSPSNSKNTICKFTQSGRCLLIGDVDGNIHVFSLEDMPIPAFFQENAFYQALKRVLITKPELVRKINKLGTLNFDRNAFPRYFN